MISSDLGLLLDGRVYLSTKLEKEFIPFLGRMGDMLKQHIHEGLEAIVCSVTCCRAACLGLVSWTFLASWEIPGS